MPCFKGLAVSIHTTEGPLPEYSIQKQSRQSRITSYIPVPPPKINPETSRPEQSTFAISITLLTPGSVVPYSKAQPTADDPFPRQKLVGGLPGTPIRGSYDPAIGPYIPLTPSPNETVAAYIHFDGRAKEEVATLLRRGVETWVNSRWVSVPHSEGGGLAEREFLFREVGLERWLNGLDLEGESKDVAARIARRKARMEKKRQKQKEIKTSDSEDEDPVTRRARPLEKDSILRYGDDKRSPVEGLSTDDAILSSDSESEDDKAMPEAAGQIKVSLFRVLASGEIKRGEYSPQFDAHDDDEGMQDQSGESNNCDADVDHTTTFAKPKTLDPKSISTQTVTGIDPPDKPYATFTFFYRGEKQLQKMGILPTPEPAEPKPTTVKRKSRQLDFSALGPLKTKGTYGFAGYRDAMASSPPLSKKNGMKKSPDEMDSDADDDEPDPNGTAKDEVDVGDEEGKPATMSPEEVTKRGELADGVKKMQLKRQHSFDPSSSNSPAPRKHSAIEDINDVTIEPSSLSTSAPTASTTNATTTTPSLPATVTPRLPSDIDPSDIVGSPFKRHRSSVVQSDIKSALSGAGISNGVSGTPGSGLGLGIQHEEPAEAGPSGSATSKMSVAAAQPGAAMDEDEEL